LPDCTFWNEEDIEKARAYIETKRNLKQLRPGLMEFGASRAEWSWWHQHRHEFPLPEPAAIAGSELRGKFYLPQTIKNLLKEVRRIRKERGLA
jgi:hypothetical protein